MLWPARVARGDLFGFCIILSIAFRVPLRIQTFVPQLGHLSHETNLFVGRNFRRVADAMQAVASTRESLGMASLTGSEINVK